MEHESYYRNLRNKMIDYVQGKGRSNLWVKYIFLAPDFFYLLTKLMTDERVADEHKLKISLAIAYFINPLDLIPDIFLSIGYLDDIVVASFVICSIIKYVSPSILNAHWPAKRDIVEVAGEVIKASEKIVGGDVLDKITSLFGNP